MKLYVILVIICAQKCLTHDFPDFPIGIGCNYELKEELYVCQLGLNDPNGTNEHTSIIGTHLMNKANSDVTEINMWIHSSVSINFPKIICDTFPNTTYMKMNMIVVLALHIEKSSLSSCTKLQDLNLYDSKISRIDEGAFENLEHLEQLNLGNNQLSELSKNIFAPLSNLQGLYLQDNNLEVLHSDIFSSHVNLIDISLSNNSMKSMDPEILVKTVVANLNATRNDCVDKNFENVTKDYIKQELQVCFENYRKINEIPTESSSTTDSPTTTLGNGCGSLVTTIKYTIGLAFIIINII